MTKSKKITTKVLLLAIAAVMVLLYMNAQAREVLALSDREMAYVETVKASIADAVLAEEIGAETTDCSAIAYSEELNVIVYATTEELNKEYYKQIFLLPIGENSTSQFGDGELKWQYAINRNTAVYMFDEPGTYYVSVMAVDDATNRIDLELETVYTASIPEENQWLQSSSWVWFDSDTKFCKEAEKIARELDGDYDAIIEACQKYVADHLTYDYDAVKNNYACNWADLDEAYESGYGVCKEYAAALTAMLRYIGIPARFVQGHIDIPAQDRWHEGHAWVEVLSSDGEAWKIYDPTYFDELRELYDPSDYNYDVLVYH